jgi:hypothetical protein
VNLKQTWDRLDRLAFLDRPSDGNGHGPDLAFEVEVPAEMREGMTYGGAVAPRISRKEALQVPAVLRARNLICATLARLPIHIRNQKREVVQPTTLLEQINPDVPNVVTFAETYEDLLFEGISWWRVTEFGWHTYPVFAEHIAPSRVAVWNEQVYIDGLPVSDDRVIRFDSPNPPLLVHAARAIRTCLTLERTSAQYAEEPIPFGYFTPKEGTRPKEDEKFVQGLLDKWARYRARRIWGYVGAAWDLKQIQFTPEQLQLADARQHAVLEIARAAGIDPEDLGVSTTSRTYQNAEQRRLDLLDFTLAHYMTAVEQRLSMRDVLPRGYRAKVNLDGFLRSDTKTRAETYKIGLPVGMYTEEDIRELEDRPALTPGELARNLVVREVAGNGSAPAE